MRRSYSLAMLCLFSVSPSALGGTIALPFWKEEVEALGYTLPKPIGMSVSYLSMEQGIHVDAISLVGLNVPGLRLTGGEGRQKTDVLTLRTDVWLLPFFNVYALLGALQGYSKTDVDVALTAQIDMPSPLPDINKTYTASINEFRLDLDGYTAGVGFVLAGGYQNGFALVDASLSQTNLTVIDGSIRALVISPRVGYDFTSHGVAARVWVGAMYQDVEQSLSGQLSDLGLPSGISALVPEGAGFHVKQRLVIPWNPLVGFQYQLDKHWYLLGEVGVGARQSALLSIDHRF
ncbi:MAG: hypothetical protein ACRCWR_02905 [Saezia sp.]